MGGRLDLLTGKWIEEKPKNKAPEAAIGRACDDFLRSIGGYVRQITSAGTLRNGRYTRGGQGPGISDRLCWLPDAKMIAVELKAKGKKRTVTEAQHRFLLNLISRGHMACVADSVDDIKKCLSQNQSEMLETLNNLMPKEKLDPICDDPLFP